MAFFLFLCATCKNYFLCAHGKFIFMLTANFSLCSTTIFSVQTMAFFLLPRQIFFEQFSKCNTNHGNLIYVARQFSFSIGPRQFLCFCKA